MEKQSKHRYSKLIHIFTSIVFYTVIFTWLAFTVSNLHVNQTSDIAHIFGQGVLSAQSSSMNGNQADSFASGDLLLVEMLDESTYMNLKAGDVITYYDDSNRELTTHRIISTYTEEGILYLETKGDYAETVDMPIEASQAIAVYKNKVQGMGTKLEYLQTPKGFVLFIMIPVFTILLYEILVFTTNVVNYKKIRFENSFEKRYREALRNLEVETTRIRQKVLSNWINKKDNS